MILGATMLVPVAPGRVSQGRSMVEGDGADGVMHNAFRVEEKLGANVLHPDMG